MPIQDVEHSPKHPQSKFAAILPDYTLLLIPFVT
jgi:hypothetical protein